MKPLEAFRPLGPANAFGHMGAMRLLEQPEVVRFVEDRRRDDGIIPPKNDEALKRNLKRYRVEKYVKKALPIAREYWEREVRGDTLIKWFESWYGPISRLVRRFWGVELPRVDFREMLRVEKLAETSARIIGKFVVADLLEMPEPINLPMSFVLRLPLDASAEAVVAVLLPGATLDDAVVEMKSKLAQATADAEMKLPTEAKRSAWLRFIERTLKGRKQLPKRGKNRTLAKYAYEMWGEDAPDEEAIRKTGYNFERRQERFLKKNPDLQDTSNPEK